MTNCIVYQLITRPGGVDGLDATSKGGKILRVYFSEPSAKADTASPWCDVVPILISTDEVYNQAKAKLSPIEFLIIKTRK